MAKIYLKVQIGRIPLTASLQVLLSLIPLYQRKFAFIYLSHRFFQSIDLYATNILPTILMTNP
jgi:hypothetical protein